MLPHQGECYTNLSLLYSAALVRPENSILNIVISTNAFIAISFLTI